MPPSKKAAKEAEVEETNAPVAETLADAAAEEIAPEGTATEDTTSPDAAVEEAAAVEDVPAQEDPAIEQPAPEAAAEVEEAQAEVATEGMAPQEFLAQKGIFQDVDELINKIKAMPDGQEKEEAIALFEKAVGQAPTAPEPIIKSGGRLVRVRKFFGSFHDSVFEEDQTKEWGEARNVSDATLDMLRSEFPGAEIEITE